MKTLPCVSVANMRESDRKTIENYVPSLTLMFRAAMGVFRAGDWPGETVIAVGSGNNGGDGFALACILRQSGKRCRVVTLSERLSPDSAHFAARARELGVPVAPYAPCAFDGADTVVDCLLGTGFTGTPREPYAAAIREMNAAGASVVSVDIPSGLNGDTGEADAAVYSDLTVTVGFVKDGLIAPGAGRFISRLVCADIGIVLDRTERVLCAPEDFDASRENLLPAPPWLELDPIDVREIPYDPEGPIL